MNPQLLIIGATKLDYEALALVLEQHSAVTLTQTSAEFLCNTTGKRVLDFHPSGELWQPQRTLELHTAGHFVLVIADFDTNDLQVLERHGLQYTLRQHLRHIAAFAHGHEVVRSGTGTRPPSRLSPRELAVARLLMNDAPPSRREIAQTLGMTPATVKVHVERIRSKLDAVGLPQAELVRRITSSGAAEDSPH